MIDGRNKHLKPFDTQRYLSMIEVQKNKEFKAIYMPKRAEQGVTTAMDIDHPEFSKVLFINPELSPDVPPELGPGESWPKAITRTTKSAWSSAERFRDRHSYAVAIWFCGVSPQMLDQDAVSHAKLPRNSPELMLMGLLAQLVFQTKATFANDFAQLYHELFNPETYQNPEKLSEFTEKILAFVEEKLQPPLEGIIIIIEGIDHLNDDMFEDSRRRMFEALLEGVIARKAKLMVLSSTYAEWASKIISKENAPLDDDSCVTKPRDIVKYLIGQTRNDYESKYAYFLR